MVLRPRLAPADVLVLSLAAGLAVCQAVEQVTGLRPDLRWPNDLLLGGKKFCGILIEMNAEATRVRYAVVGMGMNINQETFPAQLSRRWQPRCASRPDGPGRGSSWRPLC